MQLAQGAIQRILNGVTAGPFRLQVIGTKKIAKEAQTGPVKYKVLLSDGVNATACIMASQIANLVSSGEIREGTVIDVLECIKNVNGSKCIIIILNCNVIQQDVPKIGAPVNMNAQVAETPLEGTCNGVANNKGNGGGVTDPGAAAMLGMAAAPPSKQQQGYGAPQNGGYGAPPPPQPQYGAYGAPPANPYGAPPPNPYGGPPAGNNGAAPGPYGAPPPNPYGAPPGAAGGYGHTNMQQHNTYGGGGAPMNPQYRAAGGGTTARNDAPMQLTPISALNSYQNRWTVKARVTQKADIRRYSNARGEGKFFSFDFLDADGGEIRVVGWNDMCDKFFDQVTVGQVYTLTKASLRNKRGTFNQTRHQFEVHLENASVLELVQDEASIPRISFNFVPLSQLEDTPAGTVLDVIGVVESVAEPADITRKDGTQVSKRGVNIRDDSGRSIELTLWGSYVDSTGNEMAAAVGSGRHPIVAVKGARVGDYNGKTLSTIGSSTIVIDPVDESKAGSLRSWYDNGGATTTAQALSSARAGSGRSDRRVCTSIIKSEGLGLNEKPDYVTTSMYILFPRNENFCYPACPLLNNGKQCLKKLIEENPGTGDFRCERCNAQAVPDYRFIVSCQVADYSGTAWVSMFNETAIDVVGTSAGQLRDWDQNDDPRFKLAWKDCQYKEFILKLKISQDTYNDETKLRTNVVALTPIDFVSQARWNLEAIARLEQNMEAYPKMQQQQQQGAYGGGIHAGGFGGPAGGGGMYGGGGGGYGGPAAGAPQYGGGYGGPPQQNTYNQPPQQQQGWGGGGWGQQQGGGYGAPQQQQWGAAPAQNGYGATTTNAGSW